MVTELGTVSYLSLDLEQGPVTLCCPGARHFMGAAPHLVQRKHGISRLDRRACPRLLATPSVTSVQIEHAVLLVVATSWPSY